MQRTDIDIAGSTRACLNHLHRLRSIGSIYAVEGRLQILRFPDEVNYCPIVPTVAVLGARTALFRGFGWGYTGEGARGLYQLFKHLGWRQEEAWKFVTETPFHGNYREESFPDGQTFEKIWRVNAPRADVAQWTIEDR